VNGYITNIENETINNENFRKVLFTAPNSQLVVMTLLPGEEIGAEIHPNVDQFFRIETGVAKVIIDGEETVVGKDYVVIVPAGSEHNVINQSAEEALRLYTIYSPAQHADGTIHRTKKEADSLEEDN
jgi:mannose-6-phosphate isomerase-like protein (cupin superfamily)